MCFCQNLGREWRLLSEEQRAPFIEEAEKLRQMHQLEYPDYKYRPKKRQRSGGEDNNAGGTKDNSGAKESQQRRDKRCLPLLNDNNNSGGGGAGSQDRKKLKLKEEAVYNSPACYQLTSPTDYAVVNTSHDFGHTSPQAGGYVPQLSPTEYGHTSPAGQSYASSGSSSGSGGFSTPPGKVPSSPFSPTTVRIAFLWVCLCLCSLLMV